MGAVDTPIREIRETRSVCCYCGTGCGVIIESVGRGADTRIVGVRGDPSHPANFGRLCSKGTSLPLTTARTGRALVPELRTERAVPRVPRGFPSVTPVSWDTALDTAAERFASIIREHGPDAVAFYISGQLLTEDYYVFNKLARALVGTNNIDSNSRLCMSSAVAGYKATLGSDAVPCSYEDIALADLFLLAGSNTAWAHPIVFRRIEDAKAKNPELKIVVVDPRRTDTAAMADLHLAIAPGSDVVLYGAMLHVLLWEGLVDEAFIAAHTEGFAALRAQVRELTPGAAASICGLGERGADDIVTAARWFGAAKAPLSMWCQGLNQSSHGTANNAALIHLHLATGKIGKPGMGPFSLTGQPNAMGGREAGAMANLLPGHRNLADAGHRDELAQLWGVPALPEAPGKTAVDMFEAMREGKIKAVWIACTNPAHSLPDQARVREALEQAEFVVVQDAYADIETAAYADLLLPAASWGEKEGTVTNSERRISRVRAAVPPPGVARPDWEIVADFAKRLAVKVGSGETAKLFEFADTASVYAEHVSTTVGRDLDIGALSHAVLDREGPQQWPRPAGATAGQARLYLDHQFAFADGRARFTALDMGLTAERCDARHPLHLTTGRLRDQWHGMSRTGRAPRLLAHEPQPRILLHAADLARRGFKDGDLLRISSRRGEIVLPVAASDELQPGHSFIAMHWGGRAMAHAGVNQLMPSAFDPVSKQPELKHAAIRVEKAELPWRLVVLRASDEEHDEEHDGEQLLRWRGRLQALLGRFDHAALTLAGRDHPLVALSVACATAPGDALLDEIAAALDFGATLDYRDAARGVQKRALLSAGDRLTGLLLAGETAASEWLRDTMLAGLPLGELRRWLFAPVGRAPLARASAGRTVCNCFGVTDRQIQAELEAGASLGQVQEKLRCGTSCGSCLPEVRRMEACFSASSELS